MELLKDVELKENEKVVKVVRHHAIIVVPHIVISFLILVFDFFLMYYLFLQGWWGVTLFVLIIVMVAFYIFRLFFLYKKNKFIITDQRIIDFEQVTFFEKYINDFKYSKIKEIKVEAKGLFPAIFRYGNIKLILRQDVAPYELYKIPTPINLQSQINNLILRENQKQIKQGKTTDPVALVMAEVSLLPREKKIEIIKKIRESMQSEDN